MIINNSLTEKEYRRLEECVTQVITIIGRKPDHVPVEQKERIAKALVMWSNKKGERNYDRYAERIITEIFCRNISNYIKQKYDVADCIKVFIDWYSAIIEERRIKVFEEQEARLGSLEERKIKKEEENIKNGMRKLSLLKRKNLLEGVFNNLNLRIAKPSAKTKPSVTEKRKKKLIEVRNELQEINLKLAVI